MVTLVNCLMDSMAGHPLSPSFLCLFSPAYFRYSKLRALSQQLSKKQVNFAPKTPKMDQLTVPTVNTKMEARPLTLEEMEDIGKRYRQRKRQAKVPQPKWEDMGQIPCTCIIF